METALEVVIGVDGSEPRTYVLDAKSFKERDKWMNGLKEWQTRSREVASGKKIEVGSAATVASPAPTASAETTAVIPENRTKDEALAPKIDKKVEELVLVSSNRGSLTNELSEEFQHVIARGMQLDLTSIKTPRESPFASTKNTSRAEDNMSHASTSRPKAPNRRTPTIKKYTEEEHARPDASDGEIKDFEASALLDVPIKLDGNTTKSKNSKALVGALHAHFKETAEVVEISENPNGADALSHVSKVPIPQGVIGLFAAGIVPNQLKKVEKDAVHRDKPVTDSNATITDALNSLKRSKELGSAGKNQTESEGSNIPFAKSGDEGKEPAAPVVIAELKKFNKQKPAIQVAVELVFPCTICDCKHFVAHAFKKTECSGCFHKHGPDSILNRQSSVSPANASSEAVAKSDCKVGVENTLEQVKESVVITTESVIASEVNAELIAIKVPDAAALVNGVDVTKVSNMITIIEEVAVSIEPDTKGLVISETVVHEQPSCSATFKEAAIEVEVVDKVEPTAESKLEDLSVSDNAVIKAREILVNDPVIVDATFHAESTTAANVDILIVGKDSNSSEAVLEGAVIKIEDDSAKDSITEAVEESVVKIADSA